MSGLEAPCETASRFGRGSRAGSDFAKAGFVVAKVCPHEAVPNVEVESVVAAHHFVMHYVIGRRVEEETKQGIHEPSGVELEPGMAGDVEDDLPEHDQPEGGWMRRPETRRSTVESSMVCSVKALRPGSKGLWRLAQATVCVRTATEAWTSVSGRS